MLKRLATKIQKTIRTSSDKMVGNNESGQVAAAPVASTTTREPQCFLIVGLGNPGREHRNNRHNIGFMTIDKLAEIWGIPLGKVQQRAITGQGRRGDDTIILAKPQTYMNRSGDAIGPLARYYKVRPENMLVIYDEIDIPFGSLRVRSKGGSGGHNGMKSLINHLGQDFPRIRVGVGRPPGRMPPSAYVLQDFKGDEWPVVTDLIDSAVAAAETFVGSGIEMAMTRHNKG